MQIFTRKKALLKLALSLTFGFIVVLVFSPVLKSSFTSENYRNIVKDGDERTNLCRNSTVISKREPFQQNIKDLFQFRLQEPVNCRRIFDGDDAETKKATSMSSPPIDARLTAQLFGHFTKNCDLFKQSRGYILDPLSSLEYSFPIAYSIMAFKNAEQVERLLRAIYRPQNVYCLHVDAKSQDVYNGLEAVARCFDNVFMASRRVYVGWNNFTSLEADLICMEDLLKVKKKWKYFINLTGQEFPLKTNLEIVQILKAMDGLNEAWASQSTFRDRFANAGPIPRNMTYYNGLNHVTLSRAAVNFSINHPVAKELREWEKKTTFPGESFFVMLQNNPVGMPGSNEDIRPRVEKYLHTVEPMLKNSRICISRFKHYSTFKGLTCHGKFVRGICIQGVGDIHRLQQRNAFFVNKLYSDYQPAAMVCLEEWMYNRTRQQYESGNSLHVY